MNRPAPAARRRSRFHPRTIVVLTLVWMALWGSVSLLTIVSGLVLGWAITAVFWLPPIHYDGRVHLWGLIRLWAAQTWDLAHASIQLAAVSFARRVEVHPGVIRVDLHFDNDLYQVMTAQLISIVPGSLVVEASRHPARLYLHVFDLHDAAAVEHARAHALAIERRVVRAFGTADEVREVRA